MMKFEKFIRLSPRLFVLAAGLDLVKQAQSVLPFWLQFHEQLFSRSDYDFNNGKLTVDFVYRLIDVAIFPLGWLGSAIAITLLLEIYDRGRRSDA
jgi:hypothetical protein